MSSLSGKAGIHLIGFGRWTSDRVGVDPVDNREVVSLKKHRSSQIFGSVADLPDIRIQDNRISGISKWDGLSQICKGGTSVEGTAKRYNLLNLCKCLLPLN